MQLHQLISQISAYSPFDDHEAISQQKMLDFLRNYTTTDVSSEKAKEAFVRTNFVGHMTGSALLINQNADRTLLTRHKIFNKWLQFGGHADGEINLFQVALRETTEESGIPLDKIITPNQEIFDLDVHPISANHHKNEPQHFHFDVRFLFQTTQKDFVISEESHELRWFDVSEELAEVFTSPDRKRMWMKLQNSSF